MPVEIAPRTAMEISKRAEVIAADAKEFSVQPEVNDIVNKACPGAPCNPGPGRPQPCAPKPTPCKPAPCR